MSCHDIGRGMNSVVQVVLEMMDDGEIDKLSAKKIIHACAKDVHWCDGNEDEATASMVRCRCGNCMETIPKGEKIFSWRYTTNKTYEKMLDWQEQEGHLLASEGLCEKCFDQIINEACQDENAASREKEYIIDRFDYDKETYLSTGEYIPEYFW